MKCRRRNFGFNIHLHNFYGTPCTAPRGLFISAKCTACSLFLKTSTARDARHETIENGGKNQKPECKNSFFNRRLVAPNCRDFVQLQIFSQRTCYEYRSKTKWFLSCFDNNSWIFLVIYVETLLDYYRNDIASQYLRFVLKQTFSNKRIYNSTSHYVALLSSLLNNV